jgi:hypothetical protein
MHLPALVNSPMIRCVSVNVGGDVTISWDLQPDPFAEFVSYDIFYSNNQTGPFANIAVVNNYNTTSYTFIGAGANAGKKYFFIKTLSSSGFAMPYDTVRSIFLIANPLPGMAQLSWNSISNTMHPTSSVYYKIYREFPAGVWSLIDSTQNLSYTDTIYRCTVNYNYRVEIADALGCNSVSNIAGGTFQDKMPPSPPILDSVSINSTGQAILGLSPSASIDAECYVVYQQQGSNYNTLDTVCGNIQQLYTYLASLAEFGVESFAIASIDSCKNITVIGTPQNTIYLNKLYSLCDKTISLSWNPYINMQGGLKEYQVYVSINGGIYTLLTTTTLTSYVHVGVNPNLSYCYFVRAFNQNYSISSTSNKVCQYTFIQSQPSYVYITKASVTANHHIDVTAQVDNTVSIKGLTVFRSENQSGPYKNVGFVPYSAALQYNFNDASIDTARMPYYYYIQVADSCGLPSLISNTVKTVKAKVEFVELYKNKVSWDDYDGYLGGVMSYNVYRAVDDNWNPVPISNVPYGINYFIDDVSAFAPDQGKFTYYVDAMEGPGNPYGFTENASSNRVEIYQEGDIFIPNCFTPKGYNKIWLPQTYFVNKTDYILQVFDRWGQKVWESRDENEGWNGGKYEGGVYVYLLQFKTARGEFIERKGTVTMLR